MGQLSEPIWLARAKRILALAQSGQHFTRDQYDRERYDELVDIATAMLADLGNVPLTRLDGLFPPHVGGYATPSLDIRCAVVRDGRVLLVQEAQDGKWAMPGGFADIGLSAAENAEKEVFEESGLKVRAARLYAVTHKQKHDYPPDARDFYKFYFLCLEDTHFAPVTGPETLDVGFFDPDAPPILSNVRTNLEDIRMAVQAARMPDAPPYFD